MVSSDWGTLTSECLQVPHGTFPIGPVCAGAALGRAAPYRPGANRTKCTASSYCARV